MNPKFDINGKKEEILCRRNTKAVLVLEKLSRNEIFFSLITASWLFGLDILLWEMDFTRELEHKQISLNNSLPKPSEKLKLN